MGINMVILCGTVVTMPHPYGRGDSRWRSCRMFILNVEGKHMPVFIHNRDYRLIHQSILDVFRMKGRLKIHGIVESDNVTSQMRIFADKLLPDKEGQDRNDVYISGVVQGTWEASGNRYVTVGITDGRRFHCLTGLLQYEDMIAIDRSRRYAFVGKVKAVKNSCILLEFCNGHI